VTTDNREDYLVSILRLAEEGRTVKTTELAKFMSVSPASVTGMLRILSDEGMLIYEKYRGVSFSEKGMAEACLIRKKHHVIEHFLTETLSLDHDFAHSEAHRMEHAISYETMLRICDLIGNPIDCDCRFCTRKCARFDSAVCEDK